MRERQVAAEPHLVAGEESGRFRRVDQQRLWLPYGGLGVGAVTDDEDCGGVRGGRHGDGEQAGKKLRIGAAGIIAGEHGGNGSRLVGGLEHVRVVVVVVNSRCSTNWGLILGHGPTVGSGGVQGLEYGFRGLFRTVVAMSMTGKGRRSGEERRSGGGPREGGGDSTGGPNFGSDITSQQTTSNTVSTLSLSPPLFFSRGKTVARVI